MIGIIFVGIACGSLLKVCLQLNCRSVIFCQVALISVLCNHYFVFCFLFSGLFISSSVKILDTNLWDSDAVHWNARQKSSFSEALMFIAVVGDTNNLAIHAIRINLSNYHWA